MATVMTDTNGLLPPRRPVSEDLVQTNFTAEWCGPSAAVQLLEGPTMRPSQTAQGDQRAFWTDLGAVGLPLDVKCRHEASGWTLIALLRRSSWLSRPGAD